MEVEIECKTTSNDTGRKIHRQEVNCLGDLLLPVRAQLAERQGCHRILVTVPDRLSKSDEVLRTIASSVSAAVDTGAPVSNEGAQVGYTFESFDSWPEPDREPEAAVSFFEQRFGRQNAHLLFHGRPGFSVVAIMVVSAKPDSVVDTIAEQAKEAAEQCSGTRPALIALHLVDPLSRDDLQSMLRIPNGIHTITSSVFRNENRWHVEFDCFHRPASAPHGSVEGKVAFWRSCHAEQSATALCVSGAAIYFLRRRMNEEKVPLGLRPLGFFATNAGPNIHKSLYDRSAAPTR